MADKKHLTEEEINAAIKAALKAEHGVDVGFKYVTIEDALNYIVFTVSQRVKQRLRSKSERDQIAELKRKHPELWERLKK